jgi:hypothetical protein
MSAVLTTDKVTAMVQLRELVQWLTRAMEQASNQRPSGRTEDRMDRTELASCPSSPLTHPRVLHPLSRPLPIRSANPPGKSLLLLNTLLRTATFRASRSLRTDGRRDAVDGLQGREREGGMNLSKYCMGD